MITEHLSPAPVAIRCAKDARQSSSFKLTNQKGNMGKKTDLYFVLGLVFLVFIIPNGQALADVAPPHPPMGSDISPGDEITQVSMESEHVVLSIHSDPEYIWGRADISATFNMLNTGDEDEYLRVRYPMHHNLEELEVFESTDDCGVYPGTPVKNLQVRVDNEPVAVDIQYETTIDYEASNREERDITLDIPCWAHFNVYFPSHQPVLIEVSYYVSGYERGDGGTIFDYLIGTGAGWKDTIGSATIEARFPYPVSSLNLDYCWPDSCAIAGWEVIWHFKDFEPEGSIGLKTINPSIWNQVIIEQKRLEINDQDGEAWGRLAKAYKESITERKGYLVLDSSADKEIFDLSYSAYQKAIEILPEDPDWHFGFAELACKYVEGHHNFEEEKELEQWITCVNAIRRVLELDPDHLEANYWLEGFALTQERYQFTRPLVDITGPTPDFLILTPLSKTSQIPVTPTIEQITQTPTLSPPPSTTPISLSHKSTQTISPDENLTQTQSSTLVLLIIGFLFLGVGFSLITIIITKVNKVNK